MLHLRRRPVGSDGNPQRMDLPRISHVGRMGERRVVDGHLAFIELLLALLALARHDLGEFVGTQALGAFLNGLRQVVAQIGIHTPQSAQHTGVQGNQHGAHTDLADQRATMQGARATKSDQGKVARVQAALDGHQAHAPGHALVDHGQHRLGGLLQTEVHLCAQALDRSAGTFHIQAGAVAVHSAVGVDATQHHIGIGHGGFGAATAISHGAGHGPRTARAHLQHAAPVEVGNAAPARANGVHIDHGQAHGDAKVQVGEFGHLGFAVDDDGHIKTGAAHVTGDHMAEARLSGNARCGRDPSRRA